MALSLYFTSPAGQKTQRLRGKNGRKRHIPREWIQLIRLSRSADGPLRPRARNHRDPGVVGPGAPYSGPDGPVCRGRIRGPRAGPLSWKDDEIAGRSRQADDGVEYR